MDELFYYDGYQITKEYYLLDEEDIKVLDACIWMIDNRASIRVTAKNCEYSKSTFHRRIHKECKELSYELYKLVQAQMKINLEKKRGRYRR